VRRTFFLALVLAALSAGLPKAWAQDARAAVEAFVARVSSVQINDLVIDQTVTLYHPDGQRRVSGGEQRMLFKLPQRQRVEKTIEGQREIQLVVGDRMWVRQADGTVTQAALAEPVRALAHVLVPVKRRAEDLLADWRSRGIRDDVSHVARLGGRPVTVIGARPGDHDTPAVWLDPDYGVVRIVTREQLPGAGSSSGPRLLDLTFSEHRPLVGKLYFPYRQEVFMNGKLLVLFTVRSVAINTNLADALFDPASLKSP
jgi:outer membrane lipoprotein-sorting protein